MFRNAAYPVLTGVLRFLCINIDFSIRMEQLFGWDGCRDTDIGFHQILTEFRPYLKLAGFLIGSSNIRELGLCLSTSRFINYELTLTSHIHTRVYPR